MMHPTPAHALFASSRHLLAARLMALLLVLCPLGCERQKVADGGAPAEANTPKQPTPPAPDAGGAVAPQEEAPVAEDDSLAAQMERSRGQSCLKDEMCPGYLRCIEKVCATPPAISGEHNETTPVAVFRSAREEGSSEVSRFYLELATTDPQRSRGLMFRRSMKEEWGMLFIYPHDRELSFWMKNTYIPLDMVFINAVGQVVGVVEGAEPLTLSPRTVPYPSRYVLELGAGVAKKHGIEAGVWMSLLNPERDDQRPLP